MAKFSIIIPAYNLEEFLEDCLLSIQDQSFDDFEVMVVDDGSLDDTARVAQKFEDLDNRFHVIQKENGGVSSARNLGLKHATGEFVWFIDGDDYIHPESLAYLNEIYTRYPDADYITFHFKNVSQTRSAKSKIDNIVLSFDEIQLFDCNVAEEFVSAFISSPRGACLTCYNRRILDREEFGPFRLGEDTLFAKSILYKSDLVISSKEKLYYYYTRDGSASRNSLIFSVQDYFGVCSELYQFKGQRHGWADVSLMRFCFELSLVDGMNRLQRLSNAKEKQIAFKSWLSNVVTFLDVFSELAIQKRRLKLIRFTHSYWIAYLYFHIKYVPRRFIANNTQVATMLRSIRIIPFEK